MNVVCAFKYCYYIIALRCNNIRVYNILGPCGDNNKKILNRFSSNLNNEKKDIKKRKLLVEVIYRRRPKKTHRQNASLYRHFGSSPVSSAPRSPR